MMKILVRNNIFFKSLILLLCLLSLSAHAEDLSIVDVKRNITLADEDPIYKDYYINAGESSTLRKNMVVNVKRKINIKDRGTKTIGDFEALVGQLKIIHIGNKVSVGREHKLIPRDEEPMLEQIGIMSGDHIDLTNSFIDNSKPVHKKKTAEVKVEVTPQPDTAPSEDPKPEREPAQISPTPLNRSATPIPQI